MPDVNTVFVVKPIDRFVLTARRVVKCHQPSLDIHWISLKADGTILVVRGEEKMLMTQLELELLSEKSNITALYMDNYFCKENMIFSRICAKIPLFIVNYGVYFCKDEISYTFAKYFKLTPILKTLTVCKLLARDLWLSIYFGKIQTGLRETFYRQGTVLFWNDFSKRNFEVDYPNAETQLVNITVGSGETKYGRKRVLVSPSILGGRIGNDGNEELRLWKSHIERIRDHFPEVDIHLSLHPLYKGRHENVFINQGIVKKIHVGVPPEMVKEYDIIFTDTSTLYWVAESYSIKAYFLEGYRIPHEFFNASLNKRNYL
jgi:hypothetical protein